MSAAELPKSERRIIINWDGGSLWWDLFKHRGSSEASPQFLKSMLEQCIDEHAAAQVDTFVECIFFCFRSQVPSSVTDLTHFVDQAGLDFIRIELERCHHHNMEFIADLRMNDRHGGGSMENKGQFIKDHPEWRLEGAPGGLDYTYEGVRRGILTFVREVLDAYDVDGIEFDYMRWCHVFEPGEGSQNAHLLTDLTRKTRQLLDATAQRRGRGRLLLGVRVPQTLEECDYLGYDVASWIKEGLVDYVVPSDFFYTDFNTKVEEFVKLAEGTDCKIYPAIHPLICCGHGEVLMNLANYRAAAHNFYAYGADGISPFNYMYNWDKRRSTGYPGPAYMWPAALGYLRELRDPQTVSQGDRHYLFYPLWPNYTETQYGVKDDRIVLDRTESDPQGSQRFRMAEDFGDPKLRGVLQFKAVGMAEDETLEIYLNGTAVPDNYITCLFDADGQNEWQGRELPAFYLYIIDLDWGMLAPPIINGDNDLTVRLILTEAQSEGTVTIDELEVYVQVKK